MRHYLLISTFKTYGQKAFQKKVPGIYILRGMCEKVIKKKNGLKNCQSSPFNMPSLHYKYNHYLTQNQEIPKRTCLRFKISQQITTMN